MHRVVKQLVASHPRAQSAWLVSTFAAISLFFAGLRRVGPTGTAILSTVQPLVTVLLAMLVFGELLGTVQLLRGVLVLGGVLALHAPLPGRLPALRSSTSDRPNPTKEPLADAQTAR